MFPHKKYFVLTKLYALVVIVAHSVVRRAGGNFKNEIHVQMKNPISNCMYTSDLPWSTIFFHTHVRRASKNPHQPLFIIA